MVLGHKDFEPGRRVRELRAMRDREETRTHLAPLYVRVVLRAMVVAPLVLFLVSIPARYRQLHAISDRAQVRLGPDDATLAGLLDAYYPPFVLGLEVFFVLTLTLSSIAMVSRRSPDWRPMLFSAVFVSYSVWVTQTADALVLPFALQKVADLIQAGGLLLAIHFFLLFPDGRFVPRWTRLNALGWTVYCLAWGLFPGMPLSLKDPFTASFEAFLILMFLGWTVGLVAQAVRYSRAAPLQRTQTKWVLIVIAAACAGYGGVTFPRIFIPEGTELRLLYDLFNVPLFWLLALPIPFALAYAMQRYHLFDVRLIIRKTLAYALLSGSLALVYVGSVVLLQTAFRALTGQSSQLAVIASTLAIAALFRPLGARIREAIDRRFYRQKYDAAHTLNEFGSRLRSGTDLDELSGELVGAVRRTMRPEHVSLWLRPPGFEVSDSAGQPTAPERVRRSLKHKLAKPARVGGGLRGR